MEKLFGGVCLNFERGDLNPWLGRKYLDHGREAEPLCSYVETGRKMETMHVPTTGVGSSR
jgi:hypothetical protein